MRQIISIDGVGRISLLGYKNCFSQANGIKAKGSIDLTLCNLILSRSTICNLLGFSVKKI
jgi:hypothetical protein